MHKPDFFHFLHKRENPSFLAFGQNARVLPAAAFRFHIYYVFTNKYFRFLNVFVVFWCKCTTYLVKVLTPSFFICSGVLIVCQFFLYAKISVKCASIKGFVPEYPIINEFYAMPTCDESRTFAAGFRRTAVPSVLVGWPCRSLRMTQYQGE